jgi:hypothetical protein
LDGVDAEFYSEALIKEKPSVVRGLHDLFILAKFFSPKYFPASNIFAR